MVLNHYTDNWPPGALTREKMIAYREMDANGRISLQKVQVSGSTGAHKVLYASELDKTQLTSEFRKLLNAQKGADTL